MEDFTQVIRRMAHEATDRVPKRSRPTVDPAPERVTVIVEADERATPPLKLVEVDD